MQLSLARSFSAFSRKGETEHLRIDEHRLFARGDPVLAVQIAAAEQLRDGRLSAPAEIKIANRPFRATRAVLDKTHPAVVPAGNQLRNIKRRLKTLAVQPL